MPPLPKRNPRYLYPLSPQSTPRLPRHQQGNVIRNLLWGIGMAALLILGGGFAWLTLLSQDLPDVSQLSNYQPIQPLRIYTQDGIEIGQYGMERRYFVPISQIPQQLQDALLAVEDSRFREHPGVDLKGIARALLANLGNSRSQGASTITQQVARNFYLSSRKDYERKAREILLALKIEKQLSKDHILELYMNQIYLGQRAYGFEAAAQTYFGKSMTALSVAEFAMLAGLPQNPTHANPIANVGLARKRQLVVLARMRSTGVIDDTTYQLAKSEPLQLQRSPPPPPYAQHIAEMVRQIVHKQYGDEAYKRGLKVMTSLQSSDQQAAYQSLRKGLLEHELRQPYRGPEAFENLPDGVAGSDPIVAQALADYVDDEDLRVALVSQASLNGVVATLASGEVLVVNGDGLRAVQPALRPRAPKAIRIQRGSVIRVLRNGGQWAITQWPEAEGALVSLDPQNGQIRALVGGFDFERNQFNHAEKAWRQPGSSFKPFLYSAALEHGVMPTSYINDAPLILEPSSASPQTWEPKNSDGKFDGPLTLMQALARSKNMVSIRLTQMMGVGPAREWAARFGFEPSKQPDNLTLALGAGSVTPLQMARAYAILANGGYKVDPVIITRIKDSQDTLIFEAPAVKLSESQRAIPARNAFITNTMLQEVTRSGTASSASTALKRTDLFGKTGTTNEAVDAWFAGFQPNLVAVVWIGYDTPRSLGESESGGRLALPVWINFMKQGLRNIPETALEAPKGVTQVDGGWFYSERAKGDYVMRLGFDEMAKSQLDPNDQANYPPLATEYPSLPGPPVETHR